MAESEWITRKTRIEKQFMSFNPKWKIMPYQEGMGTYLSFHALKKYPTVKGKADYALFINGSLLCILDAMHTSANPQKEEI